MGIEVATAQPTLVTIIKLSPVSSTRLRPIASAISPMGSTTRAIPRTYAVTVFCASAFEDAKCAAIWERRRVHVEADLLEGSDDGQHGDEAPARASAPSRRVGRCHR